MEYRLKYRDIPWPIAIAVLPGKIIGTFILNPLAWWSGNRHYALRKVGKISWRIAKIIFQIMMILGFIIAIALVVDHFTHGWLNAIIFGTANTPLL